MVRNLSLSRLLAQLLLQAVNFASCCSDVCLAVCGLCLSLFLHKTPCFSSGTQSCSFRLGTAKTLQLFGGRIMQVVHDSVSCKLMFLQWFAALQHLSFVQCGYTGVQPIQVTDRCKLQLVSENSGWLMPKRCREVSTCLCCFCSSQQFMLLYELCLQAPLHISCSSQPVYRLTQGCHNLCSFVLLLS